MKRFLVLSTMALALFIGQLNATPVGLEKARQLGLKYVQSNCSKQVGELNHVYTERTTIGTDALYVFNFDGGFIIMAADNVSQPVLAFGEEGCFDAGHMAEGLTYYLRHYARQIEYAVVNQLEPESDIFAQWKHLDKDGFLHDFQKSSRGDIQPLIATNWNQDYPFNYYCPTGQGGPGGHAYAGCVATAMSMVLKFWNWPLQGNGEHSYTPSGYPTQTVNFGNTTYNWSNMPNTLSSSSPSAQIQAVATLMYHCGVSVDMQYGSQASGAYSQDVPDAITNYFSYTEHANRLDRDLYTRTDWEEMLITSLEEGFPLYYSGSDPDGGHAFVCCGYRESDRKFYFNWGWSGVNNSYFAIDALNTYSGSFNQNQSAIFDMIPNYIYDALIPAPNDLSVQSENAQSKTGVISWTNPTQSLDGTSIGNIDQVVLLRDGQQIFSMNNVVPGDVMQYEDNVSNFDCYTYSLYYRSNNVKGRSAKIAYQYGPTCTWKIIGQTSNFQGWNGGKLQVLNSYGHVIDEVTMTTSTPVSKQIRMPEGNISFRWIAPLTTVSNLTINIKNSSNSSVYNYTGSSSSLNGVIYSDNNDCDGCLPPSDFNGEYIWQNGTFGTHLTWYYYGEPQSFKVYRSENGTDYEEIATVDKSEHEYFDYIDSGDYYYKVTAYRSYCESTPAWTLYDTDYVYIEVTSVGENGCEAYKVFPNPVNALLSVEAEGLEQIVIRNVMGQVVYQQDCNEDGIVVNATRLASGIYTIAIKASEGTMLKRFTVVH